MNAIVTNNNVNITNMADKNNNTIVDANNNHSSVGPSVANVVQVQTQKLQPIQQRITNNSNQSEYINGRVKSEQRVNYETYYNHKEPTPEHYHPLVQYLDKTELKFYNDNLFYETPLGFPTKASILREKSYHLPIIKDTVAEKARYRRKIHDRQQNIALARKKYDFQTQEGYSSHYFLTGARYNRYDTIDSKILSKYGIFVNRENPELIYFKPKPNADENANDINNLQNGISKRLSNNYITKNNKDSNAYKSKAIQVPQLTKDLELKEKRLNANLTF